MATRRVRGAVLWLSLAGAGVAGCGEIVANGGGTMRPIECCVVLAVVLPAGCALPEYAGLNAPVHVRLPEPDPPGEPPFGAWASYDPKWARHRVLTTWVDVTDAQLDAAARVASPASPAIRARLEFVGPGRHIGPPSRVLLILERQDGSPFPLDGAENLLTVGESEWRKYVGAFGEPAKNTDGSDRQMVWYQLSLEHVEAIDSGAPVNGRIGSLEFSFPRRFSVVARDTLELIGTDAHER